MKFSFEYLWKCLLSGVVFIPVTLKLALIPLAIALVLGTLIALARIFKIPVVEKVFKIFVAIYSGIPVMVTLLIFHLIYLSCFKPGKNGTMLLAYFTFTLGRTIIVSESVRGAFLSIPKGQYEAAYACGLSTFQTLRKIVIPQMIPVALPTLTNNTLGSIKNTSIVMVLGIVDVLNGSTIPCADTYSYVEGYVAAAIIYWAVNAVVEFLLVRLEKHLAKKR
ncbi:MAG: amino acid ABC transporter permease [Treponema sp.]|uniref:amino acid ABC transporter permease n=1 Tax=Treponema sp. TaxID=166 RepID=UPI0025F51BB0|nr:amino acid ABC transporter permease [Treponema sp.]MBQ9280796.1 amino acid ABC transporter permease [Treponema sp.]